MTVSAVLSTAPAAVVFDCDGTLVDNESHWQSARVHAFADFGLKAPPDFAAKAAGVHYVECGLLMAEEAGKPELAEELTQSLLSHFTALADAVPVVLPGAAELVRLLSGRVPLAVASNCPAAVVEASLGRTGLLKHFDHLVVPDEDLRPKPEPDLYAKAAELCGTEGPATLAVEDSLTGIEAAHRAGLKVIGVGEPAPAHRGTTADWWVAGLDDPDLVTWVRSSLTDAPA
ncbi:HAD family hydrolase [Streptomyces sp. LE64]|uniref:HAD family hydrolase n=1 Tax=Streptomyces sp. LE64 TaxID=3448653 RepID=UPI0040428C20